jgi:uncharacterized protein (DUF1810 family)
MGIDTSEPLREASDPFRLERFVRAHDPVYAHAVSELRTGRKRGHWIWFIFPQIRGLGSSAMSREFAISSLDEAVAFLRHPALGRRLLECVSLVNAIKGRTIHDIFGEDDIKVRSSLTLFARADPTIELLAEALHKYFDGSSTSGLSIFSDTSDCPTRT